MKKKPDPVLFRKKILLRMKLTSILLLLFSLQISASVSTHGQVTLKMQNESIRDVFREIENQSTYRFFYNEAFADLNKKVNISVIDKDINATMDQLLLMSDMSYKVLDNNLVVIAPRRELQQQVVTGRVTDALTGEPLPGSSIVIKGTSTGTTSNVDGEYRLEVPGPEVILIYSYLGYLSREILVGSDIEINIALVEDIRLLEEIVVVGYGTQRRATLTGSIGTIQSEELVKRPAANTTELLQGMVVGLQTRQSSGLPGDDATELNIRGFGNPLIIVDGVQSSRSLEQIDPNDIESISILKDASAAVYGARAGNGVILVTTKRGAERPFKIGYHGTTSFASPTFLPRGVGASQWAELMQESGADVNVNLPPHLKYEADNKAIINQTDGSVFQGYNWFDDLYRQWTPQMQHNINASGGTSDIAYYISAGFTNQESNFKSGDYDFTRYNIRANIDGKINRNIGVAVDFSYRSSILDKANFTAWSMYNDLQTAKPVYPVVHKEDPTKATWSGFLSRSPYHMTHKDYSGFVENRENSLMGAIELNYSFPMISGLTARARLNYQEDFFWDKDVKKPFNVYEYDEIAANENRNPWVRMSSGSNQMFVSSARGTQLLPLFSLQYQKGFGNHNFSGILLSETITYKGTSLRGERRDILSFQAPYLRYASEEGKDNYEGTIQSARSSLISRINYDFKGKYMLEFAMRADASAEYPKEGRWGYFPSISGGWRISEESFITDNFNSINNLKLRGSFGILGNDAISSFAYLTGYNVTEYFFIFGTTPAPVIISSGLANPNITWETMTMYNIGIDGLFWNGLLGFEIDAFYRLREGILGRPVRGVPSTFGSSLPLTNLNTRDTRGFEVMLTHRNKIGNLTYEVSPMVSYTRSKYVKWDEVISDDPDWNNRYLRTGQWDDMYWGYRTDGFFMNRGEIDNHPVDQDQAGNQTLRVGDLKYRDINGDGVIDWRDEVVLSTTGMPNNMYSLIAGVGYKGFNLSALLQGGANYRVNFHGSAASGFSNESIPLTVHYDHRAIVGVDSDGREYITNPESFKLPPVNQAGRTPNNTLNSDFWNYQVNFLRLKNVNLSYSLPANLINRVGIEQGIFYLSGTNLWTISNLGIWKKSFDPEITGQDNRNYPPVKTMTFGIRLTI
jgi:TonB-linked SusC/RagA family outer membrane protein